jgi:hypothetical protein
MLPNQEKNISFYDLLLTIAEEKFIPVISNRVSMDYLFHPLDITEEWAESIDYPLIDKNNLARVAQFSSVNHRGEIRKAKLEYLNFLKENLANTYEDKQKVDFGPFTPLSQVATDLGYLNFEKEPEHPLYLLAKLPLPIYLTASYHSFLEVALKAVGKEPQSRVYCWSDTFRTDPPFGLQPYVQDVNPNKEKPLVYHVLGIDTVPESLVLSEDDFFDFLNSIAKDLKEGNTAPRWPIPQSLFDKMPKSSLVMFGFYFYDWAFRVAFRGVVKPLHTTYKRPSSLLIQFQPGLGIGAQTKVKTDTDLQEKVTDYLQRYVSDYSFDIHWGSIHSFAKQLWQAWESSGLAEEMSLRSDEQPVPIAEERTTRSTIFISYSHKDEQEKDTLLNYLGVLEQTGLVKPWSDDKIGAGADWEAEINKAIVEARVAILLITVNFLNSDYIRRKELPALLKQHEREGLTIIPLIARPCPWLRLDWLNKINARPKNGAPLWREDGRYVDEDLTEIAYEIAGMVEAQHPGMNDSRFSAIDG